MPQPSINKISLKINALKFIFKSTGGNELITRRLWVRSLVWGIPLNITVLYTVPCYIAPCYNGTHTMTWKSHQLLYQRRSRWRSITCNKLVWSNCGGVPRSFAKRACYIFDKASNNFLSYALGDPSLPLLPFVVIGAPWETSGTNATLWQIVEQAKFRALDAFNVNRAWGVTIEMQHIISTNGIL